MSIRQDVVNLLININGNQAQNQLNDLRKKASDISSEIKTLKRGTQEYIDANKNLKAVNKEMSDLKQTIGLTSLSMRELNAEKNKLSTLRNASAPLSKEFKDYDKQLQAVIARQSELNAGLGGMRKAASSSLGAVKQQLTGLLAGYIGIQAVFSGIGSLIKGSIRLSDQLADLRRVAGLTADEAYRLNQTLLSFDTRTSDQGLLQIAIIAGKLGVAKNDIADFTQQVDKLVVTLGDELGGADQITTQLGKILNVFDGKVTGDNISHLGNAIVDLANKGVATGGYIVDFTQRVSGIAKASNISLGATVGLAAGFEALGLRSESSSTALQKLLLTISQNIPKAAKIAGVPLKEFNQLFADQPQEALIKYTEGLVKNKKAFSDITSSFKDAGETGARVVQTVLAIGQNGEFMREQIDQGAKSIKQLSSLEDGFSLKNDNLAGSIEKVSKQFDKLIASKGVNSFLKGVADDVNGLFKSMTQISDVGFGEAISRAAKGFSILVTQGTDAFKKFRELQQQLRDQKEQAAKEGIIDPNSKNVFTLPKDGAKIPDTTTIPPPAGDPGTTEYERLKKEAEDFYKQIQKLKEDALNASKSDDEKELLALENKYKELQAKAVDFFKRNLSSRGQYNEETKALAEAFNIELAALQKKYFEQSAAIEYDQSLKDTKDFFDHQRNVAGQSYADGAIDKEQYSKELEDLDLSEKAQRIRVAEDYSATVKKAAQDVHDFKKDLEKSTTDHEIEESEKRKKNADDEKAKKEKDAADAAKAADELLQRRIQAAQELAQATVNLTSDLLQTLSNLDQRALQKDKAINDAKKNNYKKQLDAKLLSQKQYDKKVADADAELAKKKQEADLKAFKRQQALSIITALINGALAVTSTLAARPGMSDLDTFGISRAVQVAIVIATTAAQVAAIATQAPPEAAEGNWFRTGDKHSDPSGGIPVLIERDEAVMKASAMTDKNKYTVTGTPAQITSKLNNIHGGVNWESGALISATKFMERPASINPNMARIMALGGNFKQSSNQTPLFSDLATQLIRIANSNDQIIDEIKNQKKALHAVVSIKEYRDVEKQYDNARKSSGMSQ